MSKPIPSNPKLDLELTSQKQSLLGYKAIEVLELCAEAAARETSH